MPKVNQSYQSMFERLADERTGFKLFGTLDNTFYHAERKQLLKTGHRRYDPRRRHRYADQMIGSFQPFADMWKDFVDTFRPYKSGLYIALDFVQVVKGLGNLAKGLLNLILAPLYLVYSFGRNVVDMVKFLISPPKNEGARSPVTPYRPRMEAFPRFIYFTIRDAVLTASWMMEGIGSIIRGVTQIAATPLTWMRIPFRMALTGVRLLIWGKPKIEENAGIKKRVILGSLLREQNDHVPLVYDMHRKYGKSLRRFQHTSVDLIEEKSKFKSAIVNTAPQRHIDEYFSLFKTKSCNPYVRDYDESEGTPVFQRNNL